VTTRSLRRVVFTLALVVAASRVARAEGTDAPAVAVLETYAPDMPEAGASVTRQLYATIARLGYRATPETETARLTALRGPHVLSPHDLAVIAKEAAAAYALQATLGAQGDRYVATLAMAKADTTAPALATDSAEATGLEAAVDHLARSLLAPVATPSSPDDHARGRDTKPGTRLAVQTEGAFGLSDRFFYNHFAGARLDYAFTRDFALGAYVGYANLKGREGRTSNVLPYLQLEYALRFSRQAPVFVPLRFGTGYLPKNGPFLRLAAGPTFELGGGVRLAFDLLAPTFVIVHDRTVVSLDVAAEVSFAL